MTDTAASDDQQSDNVTDTDSPLRPEEGFSTSTKTPEKDDDKIKKPWPVDRRKQTLGESLHDLYMSLSYTYMNPIFEKGMNQFKSGEHLDLEDLFAVPHDMSSGVLVQKFW